MQQVLRSSLGICARIWRFLYTLVTSWPYLLGAVVALLEKDALDVLHNLYAASLCCLDVAFTRKARALAADPLNFLRHKGLMKAIWMWTMTATLSNMGCERLIALLRHGAPARCVIERYLSAGMLQQIYSMHKLAGGHDPRVLTRRKLAAMNAPLRSTARRVRKVKKSLKVKYSSGFLAWANKKFLVDRAERRGSSGIGQGRKSRLGNRDWYDDRVKQLHEEWLALGGMVLQHANINNQIHKQTSKTIHTNNLKIIKAAITNRGGDRETYLPTKEGAGIRNRKHYI